MAGGAQHAARGRPPKPALPHVRLLLSVQWRAASQAVAKNSALVIPSVSRTDDAKLQIAGRGAFSTKISRFSINDHCAVGTSIKAMSSRTRSRFKASKLPLALCASGAIPLAFALRSMQCNAHAALMRLKHKPPANRSLNRTLHSMPAFGLAFHASPNTVLLFRAG